MNNIALSCPAISVCRPFKAKPDLAKIASTSIRTYNFPQGRVTDHRINLTLYKLDRIMEGDLDELIGALISDHQTALLAQMNDGY